jgi:methyl coenzyme M reductase subunit C
VKHPCTIFHAHVGPVWIPQEALGHMHVGLVRIPQEARRTHYAKLVFLHLVGYASHIVHYGASGMRNIDPLFFMLV